MRDAIETMDLDIDEVAPIGFSYGGWLASIGETVLDESSFSASSRLSIGDGAVVVTKGGMTTTPPAPTISASQVTAAHVWANATAKLGDEILLTNTVRVGSRIFQQSVRLKVVSVVA